MPAPPVSATTRAFSPECELLLHVSRVNLRPVDRTRLAALLAGPISWDYLLQLASPHGLRPLLFKHLENYAELVPKPILAELWSRQQRLIRRNREMLAELQEVIRTLRAGQVRALPYKGPMLALAAYGDISLREFGDLDLLVRQSDLERARQCLATTGYEPEFPLPLKLEQAYLNSKAKYHLALSRCAPDVLVELHWKSDAEFPVEGSAEDSWWEGLPETRLGDMSVPYFPANEAVLVLCLHGSKHFWVSLGWLVDVAEFIGRQPDLDWRWVIARAEQLHAGRRLALGLHLMTSLLDITLPDTVRPWLDRHVEAGRLSGILIPCLLGKPSWTPSPLLRMRWNFSLYENWSQRMRHLVQVVFSPTFAEWTRWPLPRALHFLYLPLRLARLAGKHLLHRPTVDR